MKSIYLLLILLVFTSGCKKWNLKQPSHLTVHWRFNSTSSTQGNVVLNKGYFYSGNFVLSGERKEGDPILITQTLPPQKVQFADYAPLGVSLDIPMGDYTDFSVAVKIENKTNPSVRLEGIVQKGSELLPVVIEWTDYEELVFKMTNPFFLKKKKNYNLYLGFDVKKLVDNISSNLWANALPSNENGVATIVINKATNSNLFSKINQNVADAVLLTIEE